MVGLPSSSGRRREGSLPRAIASVVLDVPKSRPQCRRGNGIWRRGSRRDAGYSRVYDFAAIGWQASRRVFFEVICLFRPTIAALLALLVVAPVSAQTIEQMAGQMIIVGFQGDDAS